MSEAVYDVLIVGGGPAGSSTAYTLASLGIDVCVVEKYNMPRYKTCGGGVNVRAANLLPFSIDPVIERTINRYRFTFRGEKAFEREYPEPLTYMTQRMKLDKYLLDQAKSVGAHIDEGVTIRNVATTMDGIVATDSQGNQYLARAVVGADGANSVVARDMGLMRDVRHELALESEIPLSPSDMENWNNTVEIDLFSLWCGYGWVFPKEKHISIGVGGLKADVKTMQKYNHAYLERHGVAEIKPLRFSGHALPVRHGRSAVTSAHALLVGDAAGLLEPFTGEGIGYAIKSGQIAGNVIAQYISQKLPSLDKYTELLDKEVTAELLDAERYVRLFNRFPRLFYRLVRDSDYVWNAACLILRGERNYSDISRRLGAFDFLLRVLL
jgi:geranylgeranyl reductase family protein